MDRLQLFEHFDKLADQPGAVTKLRGVVLQLAVAGRLVTHEKGDPNWQQEISNERKRLIEALRVTKHPETPHSAQNELPYAMPEQWLSLQLGDMTYSCGTAAGEQPSSGLRITGGL